MVFDLPGRGDRTRPLRNSDMNHVPSPLDRYAPKPPPLPLPEHPVVDQVMAGNRFVTYPFVISILILSFNRNMGGVRLVGRDQWPMVPLFGATLVTMLFGWWGFPWGMIWSPVSLFHLWRGGRDSTLDVLGGVIGYADARRVLATAPKPKLPASIWLVRLFILMSILFFGTLVFAIVNSESS